MEWKISILYPGDHIRVKRDHYYHHGIYVGNDEVIHFTGLNNDSIENASEVLVRKTSLEFFLKDGVAEHAVYSRKEKRRLNDQKTICELANSRLGEGNYNLVVNNCETFANEVTFKAQKRFKRHPHVFRFIGRAFVKLSGILPYLIIVSSRWFYSSKKAKKESKNLKGGAIIISNHTSIFDYYMFIYHHFFRVIHTMVAEVVYKYKSLGHLCRLLENIKVERNDPSAIKAYKEAKEYLEKGKTVLIFPEGHLEDKAGEIEEIKPSCIKLAFETNKPIIPYYVKGNYGLFKRAKAIAGEKIYVRELVNKPSLSDEDILMVQNYIKSVLRALKSQLKAIETYKTHALVSKRTYVQDFIKVTSIPIGYLFLRARKIYLGNKKKVKQAMKEKVILAPNHTSFYDVVFMYLYFFSRRIRILALNNIWNVKILAFGFDRSGVIKYNRNAPGGFDLPSYRETSGVLEGNGAVVIFPQGHIASNGGLITETLKPGVATHSLKHNAPIIPIIFADETKMFKKNRIIIGDPIYPHDYVAANEPANVENIEKLNNVLTDKMIALQKQATKYSRAYKKGGK